MTKDQEQAQAAATEYPSPADYFFGLSYAGYLTLPRLALDEMPSDWQRRFFAMVEELQQAVGPTPEYVVLRRSRNGRLRSGDPWGNYRRGSVADAKAADAERAA